ncbi:sensor histidine kinase [Chryseolinea lacunae]|uniref:Sensor histidine kinase n=1 Tax=Chryseolinea lacunae TaxID=2801331 RepID=A0ABS1KPL9_9BACT|nr:histidine kinase [Chryseolinea lacunae]MBL0741376.1 sensor histidine kinase [Chryseolinea lacunae]
MKPNVWRKLQNTREYLKYLRIALHVLFWLIIFFFFIYVKKPLMGLSLGMTALVEVKDVIIISSIFYFLSYYVVPKLLFKRKYLHMALCLVLVYYFYAFVAFVEYSLLPRFVDIPGKGYHMYAQRLLNEGVVGILRLKDAPEILLDLSYLLSPALIMKLAVTVLNLSTQAFKLERDNLNLELAFLKSQINPHFLFNTLNNIYSLTLDKSDNAPAIVLKLADLMRYTLYDSNAPSVPLEKELLFFANYVELEKIRHTKRVTIDVEFYGNSDGLSIAPLIIFPFIENAFKHGINKSIKRSWVSIRLGAENGVLKAEVGNSRFSPTPTEREKEKNKGKKVGGIGIANARKRLDLLYPHAYTLNVVEDVSSFLINLTITLK